MKTVYDSEGRAYTVDSVDAREYVATGNYFYEVMAEVKEPVISQEEDKPESDDHKKHSLKKITRKASQ